MGRCGWWGGFVCSNVITPLDPWCRNSYIIINNPSLNRIAQVYSQPHSPFFNMAFTTKATIASFGGKLLKLTHNASTTSCEMALNLYLPPASTLNPLHRVPVLIFLSGLTCTGDNCSEKGFFQHMAAQKGISVVYPDTSPREFRVATLLTGAFLACHF